MTNEHRRQVRRFARRARVAQLDGHYVKAESYREIAHAHKMQARKRRRWDDDNAA